jgi:protein arginine N-methyltransferase 1
VTLPVRADVILSDLRGVLPLFARNVPAIVDARRRFLRPGGTLIPGKDTLWAAIVEVPKPYGELVDPWERNPFGQDLSPARQMVVNNFQRVRVSPAELLTVAQLWTTLDYGSIEDPDARGDLEWRVERTGTGHGILVWFDTELADGIGFSNAPGAPETIYASLFFPWTQPVSLVPGQAVGLFLEAKLVENDYVWRWTTRIEPPEGTDDSRIYFEQSQLTGAMLSLQQLRRTAADYVPHLSEEGQLHKRTFDLMDGKASLEEIAHRLVKDFPERFPRWEEALSYASAISQDYSR